MALPMGLSRLVHSNLLLLSISHNGRFYSIGVLCGHGLPRPTRCNSSLSTDRLSDFLHKHITKMYVCIQQDYSHRDGEGRFDWTEHNAVRFVHNMHTRTRR